MTNTSYWEYSIKTPDDVTVDLSETYGVLYQNKLEK